MDRATSAAVPGTRVEQAMQAIRERIAARRLKPGARLPSIRAFAETQGVSKSTVVDAYDRLVAAPEALVGDLRAYFARLLAV